MPTPNKEFPFLSFFDQQLTKEDFIAKFCVALKKYVMCDHPMQSESPTAKKVAEQGWQQYLTAYNFFTKKQVVQGKVKVLFTELQPEDLDRIYFEKEENCYVLCSRERYMQHYFRTNPGAFDRLPDADKAKIQSIMNLPSFVLSDTDIEKGLINYQHPLMGYVGSSMDIETMFLIQLDADVNLYSPLYGNTPLLLSVSKGWNHKNTDAPLSSNVYQQKAIIKKLIEEKAEVNAIHLANGFTALHIACLRGDDPDLIKLLLDNGANIHMKDYLGRTPLELMDQSYEAVQKIIYKLTTTPADHSYDVGFGYAKHQEHQSWTATLPDRSMRLANQAQIRVLIESVASSSSLSRTSTSVQQTSAISLGQNSFSVYGASIKPLVAGPSEKRDLTC